MKALITDHQGKSLWLAEALASAGWTLTADPREADVVLIDHDVPFHGKLPFVEACVAHGGRAFLYPHGADAALMAGWDMPDVYPVSPLLSGALVIAPGYAEVARRYGYPHPCHVVGWPFCDLAPRRRSNDLRVLFAPTHPPYLGNPRYPGRNAEMFGRLLQCPVDITVRHVGPREMNGIWHDPRCTYVTGDMHNIAEMVAQIDAHDAVLADRGTFANLAVARGVTTVVWDAAIVHCNDGSRSPDHLDAYRDYIRYPFDADDGGLWQVLCAAAEDTDRVAEWRERFIGGPVSIPVLVNALEER